MEQIKWYESTTLRALLLAFVSQVIVWTGAAETLPTGAATLVVDAVLQVVAIVATGYAAWARANRANPPITDTAMRKTEERQSGEVKEAQQSQGGFARPLMLAVLLAASVPVFVGLHGCASTQSAYKEADSFTEQVFVVLSHWESLQDEAIRILEAPTGVDPAIAQAIRAADAAGTPVMAELAAAEATWSAVRDAKTEAELQIALDNAVKRLAELLRANKRGRLAQ